MAKTQIRGIQVLNNSLTSDDIADELDLEILNVSGSLNVVGTGSLFIGTVTISGSRNLAGGAGNTRAADDSFAFGSNVHADAQRSYAIGDSTTTNIGANASFAAGAWTQTYGLYSHAEGIASEAWGYASHAEGSGSIALGILSHAEGTYTLASGTTSHAEGQHTEAIGYGSHAEGSGSISSGSYSHASGLFTIASGSYQTVIGKYNKRDNSTSLFVIGNGTGNANGNRSDLLRANNSIVEVTGTIVATQGISGSLTKLSDGTSYIRAGSNVTVTSGSGGFITISSAGGGGGGSALLPIRYVVPASIIQPSTTSGDYIRVGVINLDPSIYTTSGATQEITFTAFLEVQSGGGAGLTAQLQLFNLDTSDVIATLTSMATPASTPSAARQVTSTLTVGGGSGELPNSLNTYELQLKRVSGGSGDTVFCSLGQFEITYT